MKYAVFRLYIIYIRLYNEVVQEILARISKYKATPFLADKVLSNSYFIRKFDKCESDGEKEELIHEELITRAKEIEEQLAVSEQRNKSVVNQNEELSKKLEDYRAESDSMKQELLKKIEETTEKTNNVKRQSDIKDEKIKGFEEKEKKRLNIYLNKKMLYWKLEVFIPIILNCISIYLIYLFFSNTKSILNVLQMLYDAIIDKFNVTGKEVLPIFSAVIIVGVLLQSFLWTKKSICKRLLYTEEINKKRENLEKYYQQNLMV